MTPREFFEQVTEANAKAAVAAPGDLRCAVNAIMTGDAFFGVLHAALHATSVVTEPKDDKWKETLAKQNDEYRLLRDTAYALKHGRLDGRKQRLVSRPDQIFTMPGAFDPAAFDPEAFDTAEQVWVETDATDYPAVEVIGKVADFARSVLARHGM